MITKLSHVGIVVRDIDEALSLFTDTFGLALNSKGIIDVPELGLRNAFLEIGDNYIELIEGTNPKGEIAAFLERKGEGLYHICLEVEDVDAAIESFRNKGADVLEVPPMPGVPFIRGFVKRKSARGVLIEFGPKGWVAGSLSSN